MYPKLENGNLIMIMIICQVHFWLQRSDIVYLLLRIAYKEIYGFSIKSFSQVPLIRIEELVKKRELKSLLVISSGT